MAVCYVIIDKMGLIIGINSHILYSFTKERHTSNYNYNSGVLDG